MVKRREVNVARPEHSWIPFYRELARELVEGGWRERQGELVGMLQRIAANGVPMPRVVEYMRNDIDPFTVFALFSRQLRFENQLSVINALKTELKISVPAPKTRPIIPYADNRMVGFFSQFVDIEDEIETMWDLFELTAKIKSIEDISNNARLQTLIDTALNVRGFGISKLTSALYWVNPFFFLHSDTVDAVGGKDVGSNAEDGKSYLQLLIRSHDLTSQPMPEINIAVYQGKAIELISSATPRIWVIRAQDGQWTDAFANNGYIGLDHGMNAVDMSAVSSREEVRRLFVQEHPGETNERSISNRSSQVARFHLEIKSGDYVLTPGLGDRVRYGMFSTDDCYYISFDDGLPCRNRRRVEWSPTSLDRRDLPGAALQGGTTLYEVNDPSGLSGIFDSIKPSSKPNVWIVRGGRQASAVERFIAEGYSGIGFNLQDDDLSTIDEAKRLEEIYLARNPEGTESAQIKDFCLNINVGDYILMPGPGSQINYFGKVASDLYYRQLGPYENRRDVEWSEQTISRRELDLSGYRATVRRPNADVQASFFQIIDDGTAPLQLKMPEDSWVPFHLEVGRKLIEVEWWLEEKRDEFARMVHDIRWGDTGDVGASDGNKGWGPDPYSFYDSFSIRTTGPDGTNVYQKIKELMRVEADAPSEHYLPYGLRWGWDVPIDDEAVSFLWEFFRFAVEFDPLAGDANSEQRFIEYYDRVSSADFLPGKRGRVWSYFLYWIDPTKYVIVRRLRQQDLGLVVDLGIAEELWTGREYLKALKGIKELGAQHGFTVLDVNRKSTTREMLGLGPIVGPIDETYDVDAMLADGVFLERSEIERMVRILRSKRNLILQGPPGVGKTFIARKLAYVLMGKKSEDRITSVQFHQSYSYEDFVGGFRPDVEDGQMVFTRQDGPFLQMCAMARANPDDDYVMLIDEINRGNLSRVFGELLMLIEADKRTKEFGVTLQHRPSDPEGFFVPENVYIIGTMNLADRSLTGMNVAMRRRFGFVDLKPQFGESVFEKWLRDETDMPSEMQRSINSKLVVLNNEIAKDPSMSKHYAVGHSFFCPSDGEPVDDWSEWYETVIEYQIRPLLEEYWFDNETKAENQVTKLQEGIGVYRGGNGERNETNGKDM